MEFLSLVPTTVLGYTALRLATHPEARIWKRWKKLPAVRIGRFQLLPVIRIRIFGRKIHLHHWADFSVLLFLSVFTSIAILDHIVTRGLLIGGIIQGLSLSKRHRKIFSCSCPYCVSNQI